MIFNLYKKVQKMREKTKAEKKALLREGMSAKWFDLSEKDRLVHSKWARVNLTRYLDDIGAKKVLFYASMHDEPRTDEILSVWIEDPEKTLILTRVCDTTKQLDPYIVTCWEDLERGKFGIRMPKKTCQQIDLIDIDAIVIPGRVFDTSKNRLGRGFGFYDRFLSVIPEKVKRIGFALDFQLVDKKLPVEDHDIPMDVIITTKAVI